MKEFYESYVELAKKRQYGVGLNSERNNIRSDSQFLNSRPEIGPLMGIIPMTGKGIEADVDDLFFAEN